jgi:hypothetical protein
MRWEAIVWSGLAVLAPVLTNLLWPRWRPTRSDIQHLLESAAPWLHGIGPAYLALITGAILERDAGLRGFTLIEWIASSLFALVFIAAWTALSVRVLKLDVKPEWLLDEPRFALYRATGVLWLGGVFPGLLLGFGMALVEWLLLWREQALRREPQAFIPLVPLAGSTLLFAITGNFFITLISQAGISLLSRRFVKAKK